MYISCFYHLFPKQGKWIFWNFFQPLWLYFYVALSPARQTEICSNSFAGLEANNTVNVMEADHVGPVPSIPTNEPDYLLMISWAFVIFCSTCMFVKSTKGQQWINRVRILWQEHQHIDWVPFLCWFWAIFFFFIKCSFIEFKRWWRYLFQSKDWL